MLFSTASVQSPCDVAITDYKYSIPSINNYQKRLNSHNSSWKCKFYMIFKNTYDFYWNLGIFWKKKIRIFLIVDSLDLSDLSKLSVFKNFDCLIFSFRSLSLLLATSFGAPDVRKVPPRTPPQRLDTLLRFSKEYIDGNIDQYRPSRTNNQKEAVQRIFDRLMSNYSKVDEITGLRICSFFDPSVPNGGPRPDNTGKRTLKDLWVQKELCALGMSILFWSKMTNLS